MQRIPMFQLSKVNRQQSAFITCFVQAHCILHVQFCVLPPPECVRRSVLVLFTREPSIKDVRHHPFCPIEPTFFVTKICLLPGISLPILPQISSKKKREGHSSEMQKKEHEHTTVLNKQKRTICVFKCWLTCQLASFEALRSLEKTIDDPTPSWSAVLFCVLSHRNDIRQKKRNFLCVSCHIGGTCPVKEFSGSRNGAFFWDQKKRPRRTSPVIDVSTCFLLDVFSTWFKVIEQATVVSRLLHVRGTRENVRTVRVPHSLETWEC